MVLMLDWEREKVGKRGPWWFLVRRLARMRARSVRGGEGRDFFRLSGKERLMYGRRKSCSSLMISKTWLFSGKHGA